MASDHVQPVVDHDAPAALTGAWYRNVSAAAWRTLALAGLGWMFDVYETFMLALTIPALIAVFHLAKSDAGAIGSLLAGGMVLGGIAFGWVADKLGRVRALMICITVYSIFSGLTGFAQSAHWVGILRFLSGLGMGGAWTCGAALVAETWHPAHRGKGGALMQIGLPVGSIVAIGAVAVIANVEGGMDGNGWRIAYFLGFLPAIILIPLALKTPESPIWLRHRQQARAAAAATAGAAPGRPASRVWSGHALFQLVRATAFIFCAQYIYWGVFTWTPAFLVSAKHLAFVHSLAFTLSQQIGSIAGFLVFAALIDRFGRRPAFLLFFLIGALAVIAMIYETERFALMAAMFFTGFGITGIFGGLGPLTAELAPAGPGRGLFMGIAYNGGRLGGILAPLLIGLLANGSGSFTAGMATTIPAFIAAAILIALTKETKGIRLA